MYRNPPVPPERISKIQLKLQDLHVEALIFLDIKNIRYLTGFSGSDGALMIGEKQKLLLVDGRYTNQAKKEVGNIEVAEYQEKIDGIEAALSDGRVKSAGFESSAMNVSSYLKLKEKLKAVTLNPMSDEINAIRAIKDEEEIACIKNAAEISFQALTAICNLIKPGAKEKDIAIELEFRIRKCGAELVSFPTIVATGANSAQPHAAPGSREIENGDIVMIDYGAVYHGYNSDETCTFIVGSANKKQKDVYSLVKQAHDRALEAIKPGTQCREIDRIARSCIEGGNLGNYFTHSTGHGVGLDVHEAPRIADKSANILETGMVITIEPGVYIPDLWGIRIEDMVLVKEGGCEVLTKVPKNLTILQ
ncbi:MAG TPA: Xaa-Pro peptidase family protein [Syntrophales bacterium]|nr:Xaa-Pro peptidase family protein [Syntrophales bacterium]